MDDSLKGGCEPNPELVEKYYNSVRSCYLDHRAQLQAEDTLIGQRVTWLVSAQAFLLGTFALLINTPSLFVVSPPGQSLPATAQVPNIASLNFNVSAYVGIIELVRWIFVLSGLLISVAVFLGVLAALRAVTDLLRSYRGAVEYLADEPEYRDSLRHHRASIRRRLPRLISSEKNRVYGVIACAFLPSMFGAAWLCILLVLLDVPKGWIVAPISLALVATVYVMTVFGKGAGEPAIREVTDAGSV